MKVERATYSLELGDSGRDATLRTPGGSYLATLRLFAALDRVDAPDETLRLEPPRRDGDTIEIGRRSTIWERAGLTIACHDDRLELRAWVGGAGALDDVHLLAGRSLVPGWTHGYHPSGSGFRTLFTPNPSGALGPVRPAAEGAAIGVVGDSEPGRRHWLFTPAPLCLGLATADDHWTGLWLAAPVDELSFPELRFEASEGGIAIRLPYEGHTQVDGEFWAPALVLAPGVEGGLGAVRRYREDLVAKGFAAPPAPREVPGWWREPIFCGWGAQNLAARGTGRLAADFATQAEYDAYLAHLERHGIRPGTITIDDKWQAAYGTNEPDVEKWPDLRGFIDERHARGQRVLLWWKAWDPEGLPQELCIRNPDGAPVGFDPSNPAARAELRRIVAAMLSPDGLDADGFKVDFTARTPSGRALTSHGPGWGIALLHRLLEIVYAAAKETKPDALVVTQTPHPSFADVTDMIRLNDMLLTEAEGPVPPVVPQMRYRADVARAACPALLVDTDDWCVPDLATWRDFLDVKLDLGVPALYYVTGVDSTGEEFEERDYASLRDAWARWREGTSTRR